MTVFTPSAIASMLEKGTLKTCKLSDWKNVDGDEMFVYFFPSKNIINFENGDGDFIEIIDFKVDLSELDLSDGRTIPASPNTLIYYR
jgi:hypothetical protein